MKLDLKSKNPFVRTAALPPQPQPQAASSKPTASAPLLPAHGTSKFARKGAKKENALSKLCKSSWQGLPRIIRATSSEREKIAVKSSMRHALLRCAIHFIPISLTILLAVLNLKGYFIGGTLAGSTDDSSQAIYRLCLQV